MKTKQLPFLATAWVLFPKIETRVPSEVSGLGEVTQLILFFAQAEASAVAEIRRRYGDHLYAKHDYDAAMAQYVATIGFMEPSYVIRKFLDAQRIHNLTSYLEELHSQARCYI